ncbi:type I-E CRISPR-associated protein Cse1/CasA [Methanocalculus sp.]|uniref:type I-E CRISPR-associated protein Cse1/CasA n=1 Tax=Methanocalculus sp. TaxID=2004547 RepID=UPI00260F79A6|nr:type I-E CRISPR-associated protein Cse1/CasA [Methanocalculus sp.]MDG6249207.1 type I-E CRISPR-associated protein Cse1/CasA [Methanocalculus sp.]
MVNLIQDTWIPAIREDTTEVCIAPWQVALDHETNPLIRLAAPRPDFNGALIQFLIGLMQTTCPPKNEREWFRKFESPPDEQYLRDSFERYAYAFELDGEGPRFMQDINLSEGNSWRIEQLLIEMPGENALKENTDHFIKRNTVQQLCLPCCAMALYTLQTNAPSGGRGHRTSLRGGGPLTSIVISRTLWETIWLNVIPSDSFTRYGNPEKQDENDIFPWLAPTRTSESEGSETTPQHVNPAQMFWGMPRRIRLECDTTTKGICDLCGCSSDRLYTSYLTKNMGVNYSGNWQHVLTAYTNGKSGKLIPQKGQPGGISYRNWLGLIQSDTDRSTIPAVVVHNFRSYRQNDLPELPFRLWTFGYEMDKIKLFKPLCWYEGTMPLIKVNPLIREDYEVVTAQLIKTATIVINKTKYAIWSAFYEPKKTETHDQKQKDSVKQERIKDNFKKTLFTSITFKFWQNTEAEFYKSLYLLKDMMENGEDTNTAKWRWIGILENEAETLFDDFTQLNMIGIADPKRISLAYKYLQDNTSKSNPEILKTLDLQPKNNSSEYNGR